MSNKATDCPHCEMLADALQHLLNTAVDIRLGYRDRDLHESWSATLERAQRALVLVGRELDEMTFK